MLKIFRNTLYIRIVPDRITILHVESGHEISDIPAIAIETKNGKSLIIAAGRDTVAASAARPNVKICNGFQHPRTIIADFMIAERTLRHFVKQAMPKSFFIPSPTIIIHPQAILEGGLTQIEIRAFAELGAMVGAKKVYIWEGQELTKEKLSNLCFSGIDGKLLYPDSHQDN